MKRRRIYQVAPITEAIIDLRVDPRPDLNLADLKQLCDDCAEDFPDMRPILQATGTMSVGLDKAPSATARQTQVGFRSISADEKLVCQRQLQGFTFSRLAPYERWEPFKDMAQSIWKTYRGATTPQRVARLAVRYVNRIDIPEPSVDLKDYFRTSPEISSDLPQVMEGFFMQVRLPQTDIKASVIINNTIVPAPRADVLSVVLDIDLFRSESVSNDETEIWEYFETLHDRKNEVFEACITDKTRGLFD